MYKVYCDNYLLHNMTMPELKLINPKLDLEVNKAGSFTFTIYPSHPYFSRLKKLKSIITVYKNDRMIFRGRILNTEEGFKNQKQVTCEGDLAFFNDSIQRPYEFSGDVPDLFNHLITEHNKQVDSEKQFKVGTITVTDPNGYIVRSDSQYLTTYDSLMKKLVENLGGYLSIRHETDGVYLDYLEDFTKLNAQNIELRKNILDLKNTTKGEDIVTAIIPLGAKLKEENEDGQEVETGERLTIAEVNGGVDYVYDEDAVAAYGWIFKTVTWDDVTIASNLLRKAKEELADAIKLTSTIEVNAVDLSGTGQNISSFSIGAYNKVISDLHGLDDLMLVTKMSLNLTAPQSDKLTLGFTQKTLTELDKDGNDKYGNIVEIVETIISNYQINTPIIQEIINRLTLTLTRNHTMVQSYNPTSKIYTPNYTKDPLKITPKAEYRGKAATCTYVWKRLVNGTEQALVSGETVDSNGVLTIKNNMAGKTAIYICYATYKKGETSLVANATIDLNRVDDGNKGETGSDGKDAAIQSDTEPEDKTQLWLDTSANPPLLKQWNGEEWVIVNDVQEQIQSLRQELLTSIEQTSKDIKMEVAENYYTKDDANTLIESVNTQYEQTKKDFTFSFNEFRQSLEDYQNGTNAEFENISKYIRFVDGKIQLGVVGNALECQIANDRISFFQNDVEVAYFAHNKFFVRDGEFTSSLTLGNFAFVPRANGNLSFKKVR